MPKLTHKNARRIAEAIGSARLDRRQFDGEIDPKTMEKVKLHHSTWIIAPLMQILHDAGYSDEAIEELVRVSR